MKTDLHDIISLSSDTEFEKAVQITKELKEKAILTVEISLPYPWGIKVGFDSDRLDFALKNKELTVDAYNKIFGAEISEMILANITLDDKAWLRSKMKDLFKDNVELKEKHGERVREILLSRLKTVEKKLIDKSLKETFALRKVTKNKVISSIDWEIVRKVYNEYLEGFELPPFTTLELSFVDTVTKIPPELSSLLEFGGLSSKGVHRILVDLNLDDIKMLINKLTEIKSKLEKFSEEKA